MRCHPSRFVGASSLLVGAAAAVVAILVTAGPAAALAEPTPTPSAEGSVPADQPSPNIGPETAGEAVCTVTNTALDQISGMAATDKGFLVVESEDLDNVRIYTLDDTCKATSTNYTVGNPLDPEDLAVGKDGAIWVAEIGDDDSSRETVAVFKISPGTTKATIYRMTYPDGKHDAEALLLDKDDVPIIITKTGPGGKAGIYRPTKALVPETRTNLPVLEKVGVFAPLKTGTANPFLAPGQTFVTGAAKSPDGTKVVIRTYSDAYEFAVTDDNVVQAITSPSYVVTRLPNEPQGEAITYSVDGASFLTLSQKPPNATDSPKLLKYAPYVPEAAGPSGSPGGNLPPAPGENKSWFDKLTFSDLTRLVAAVGVVGLVLAITGIIGIRRARRRRREEEYDYDDYDEPRRRRGRGRVREDETGFAGLRDSRYQDHDQYGGYNGYGGQSDNGFGSYAESGYGVGQGGGASYGANAYGGDQYGGGEYAGQQYGGGQYAGQQYGGQSSGGDPYGQYGGGQQYGGQYGEQDTYGQPYDGHQYSGGQNYAGQGYPGYGYEDDFDPMQDPRRR